MITQETKIDIEKSGEFVEKAMSIKANGKAFKGLVAGAYTDKPRSVIIEACQNSADSHIRAGNYNPFEVTLPSSFAPNFIVRDYGVGMTHSYMMNEYSVLFESSKNTDNAQVGAFGLGRCSPLCMTDSYSVTCFDGEKKRIYNIFYNEQCIPSIAFLNEEECSEPRGVEICVSVAQDYINDFRIKAPQILKYFPIKPIIKNSNVTIPDLEYIVQSADKTWGFTKTSNSTPVALMGCYSYPIITSSIPNLTTKQQNILSCSSLIIHFNIGELDVTISREGLSYDPQTCENIKKKLDKVVLEIKDVCKDLLANCKTLAEAYETYGEIFGYNGKFYSLRYALQGLVLEWQGIKINTSEIYLSNKNLDGVSITYVKPPRRYRASNLRFLSCGHINFSKNTYYCHHTNKSRSGSLFVENDSPKPIKLKDRIQKLWNSSEVGAIYIFNFTDAAAKQKAIEAIHYDKFEITLLSSLPFDAKPSTATGYVKNGKHSKRVFTFDAAADSRTKSDFWKSAEVDLEKDSGVYVEITQFEYRNKNGWLTRPSELTNIIGKLSDAGITAPTIYGIKEKYRDKVVSNKNWVNLWDYVKEKVGDFIINNNLSEFLAQKNDVFNICNYSKVLNLAENYSKFNGDLNDFFTKINNINKETQKHTKLEEVASLFGVAITKTATNNLSAKWEELKKKYPLLAIIVDKVPNYYYSDIVKDLVAYEKLVNRDINAQNVRV